ncbi:MAG: HAMP domain-containing histidine kinase [Actinobacteria bacterium]|nr:HAMP domain-containing histidine kinase [Actinomycetota bacterium]
MSDERVPEDPEARFARLVSVVRHELLGPLTVIRGFAETLPVEALDGEAREALAAIRRNANLAHLLLNRLRDADDIIRGGDVELDRSPTDVAALVRDTLNDVADTLLGEHELEFRSPHGDVAADVDGDRIRQVLFNLLSNAAKYSEPSTTIVVAVQDAGDAVEVAVTDQGEGIAPEDVDRAFEAFTRLSDEHGGTGLGLAIARAIARAHGGDVIAEPAPEGPGSRFILRLPTD